MVSRDLKKELSDKSNLEYSCRLDSFTFTYFAMIYPENAEKNMSYFDRKDDEYCTKVMDWIDFWGNYKNN
jgi:hypothetical protein